MYKLLGLFLKIKTREMKVSNTQFQQILFPYLNLYLSKNEEKCGLAFLHFFLGYNFKIKG